MTGPAYDAPLVGWYPDPSAPGIERYWSGSEWTAITRPSGQASIPGYPSPTSYSSMPVLAPPQASPPSYGQLGYGQPSYGQPGYGQPFYAQPVYVVPVVGTHSKATAALLAFFLGGWGIHNFYLGHTTRGILQIALWLVGAALSVVGVGFLLLAGLSLWVIIEFVMILSGGLRDSRGLPLT
jgi:TM2 domain-containing membrane protein YozV